MGLKVADVQTVKPTFQSASSVIGAQVRNAATTAQEPAAADGTATRSVGKCSKKWRTESPR